MKVAINILKVIMIPAVAIYPLYFNILGGLTFIIQAQQYFANELIDENAVYMMYAVAGIMFVSSVLFAAAMVLSICKFNMIAVFLDIGAIALCIFSAFAMNTLNTKYEMEMLVVHPMTDKVFLNHLPSLIPFFAIFIVGLVQNIINDHAMGPDWKEYKKIRREHKKLIKEKSEKNKQKEKELKKENKKAAAK